MNMTEMDRQQLLSVMADLEHEYTELLYDLEDTDDEVKASVLKGTMLDLERGMNEVQSALEQSE